MHYLEKNGNVKEVDQYLNKQNMKKSQLKNIIRQVIKEHIHPSLGNYAHHIDPNNDAATVTSLYGGPPPLQGNGTHVYDYKANICPAKYAMHYFGTPNGIPLADAGNWVWLNQQYSQAGIQNVVPVPTPNAQGQIPPNTQMFDCFQVHPVAEQWYQPYMQPAVSNGAPPLGNGSFADLPQIQGQYSAMQQGVADGWLYPGGIAQCNSDCAALAVDYDECNPPGGGCPDLQTPWGPVSVMWQGFPICRCVSPSVGNPGGDVPIGIDPNLTVATGVLAKDLECQCCDNGYPISMNPIPFNTTGGCSSLNGGSFYGCADTATFDPKACERRRGGDDVINCTCCDDLNPGTGLSPNPPIPVGTPGGCSSLNGPYGSTVLSGCEESSIWNVSSCEPIDPCDSWIDPGYQGRTCCEWCNNIGWPSVAPTNISCGGTGAGGDPSGANNWFCECCPEGLMIPPTDDPEGLMIPPTDDEEIERMKKLAGIPKREL